MDNNHNVVDACGVLVVWVVVALEGVVMGGRREDATINEGIGWYNEEKKVSYSAMESKD